MQSLLAFLLLSASAAATGAAREAVPGAASAKPLDPVIRLTPEQVEDVLAEAGRKPEVVDDGHPFGTSIHGVMGFEVGSDGARAAFGAATIPLGDDAVANVYYETSRSPTYRRLRRYPY